MPQSRQLTIAEAISQAKQAGKRGNNALAAELYSAVLRQQPDHPVARKGLRRLQRASRTNQARAAEPPQQQVDALISLYHSGQVEDLEQYCNALLRSYPGSLIVLNLLGTAFQLQGKYREAVETFDKAIEYGPDSPDAYSNRGNALKELRRLGEAVASYDKAIELKPDYPEAYHNRGNALGGLGQLEAAAASYAKAIYYKPDFASAHLNLSALKEYTPDDPQLEAMQRLLADPRLHESARTELCFAAAKACEDLGQYDKSFEYLAEGNRLRKKDLRYDIADDRKLFARIKRQASAGTSVANVEADETASKKPLFVVGMLRSGTSLVEQILASHTQVHGAGELETINQFATPLFTGSTDRSGREGEATLPIVDYGALRSTYLGALEALEVDERIITDKMPLNFRWIGIILSAIPEAKIVHLKRDPMATCWSIYKRYFGFRGNGYAYDLRDVAEYYRLYADLMAFWHQKYPNAIYDVCYERLTENQEAETRRLLEFCNLEWQEECLNFHRTTRLVKTLSATQVRRGMYRGSSEAWRKFERHLQPLAEALGIQHERVSPGR